jgi:hypothetical protein
VTKAQSPVFAKVYDFLKWLLPATAKFPKQQRFVLARQIEDEAFAFHRALFRAAREPRPALAEADVHLAALRTYLRLASKPSGPPPAPASNVSGAAFPQPGNE